MFVSVGFVVVPLRVPQVQFAVVTFLNFSELGELGVHVATFGIPPCFCLAVVWWSRGSRWMPRSSVQRVLMGTQSLSLIRCVTRVVLTWQPVSCPVALASVLFFFQATGTRVTPWRACLGVLLCRFLKLLIMLELVVCVRSTRCDAYLITDHAVLHPKLHSLC